jgi:hypothetical protein
MKATCVTRTCMDRISIQKTHDFIKFLTSIHFCTHGRPEDGRNVFETFSRDIIWRINININSCVEDEKYQLLS